MDFQTGYTVSESQRASFHPSAAHLIRYLGTDTQYTSSVFFFAWTAWECSQASVGPKFLKLSASVGRRVLLYACLPDPSALFPGTYILRAGTTPIIPACPHRRARSSCCSGHELQYLTSDLPASHTRAIVGHIPTHLPFNLSTLRPFCCTDGATCPVPIFCLLTTSIDAFRLLAARCVGERSAHNTPFLISCSAKCRRNLVEARSATSQEPKVLRRDLPRWDPDSSHSLRKGWPWTEVGQYIHDVSLIS
jgi:hypothetical protein